MVTNTENRTRGKAIYMALTAAVIAVSIAMLLGFTEPAKADQWDRYPLHTSGGARVYSDGTIHALLPTMIAPWYGGLENVRWSVDLYKWNGYNWVLVDSSKPWYQAGVNRYGLIPANGQTGGTPWTNMSNGYPTTNNNSPRWRGLSPGYYAVKEYYWWLAPNVVHTQWSHFNNTNYQYCRIG
jgi:hypothetical protein